MVRRMWSMPHNILRIALVGVCAAGALGFVVGLNGAGPRPRLPGEPLEAANQPPPPVLDTQPISPEEIAPAGPTPEEKARAEAAAAAKLAAAQLEKAEPVEITPPPVDRVGELLDAAPPPPTDDIPH
jgi:hypothetical protein